MGFTTKYFRFNWKGRIMSLEIGKTYYGFKLIEEKPIAEINSHGRLFVHEKTGAQLLHLENDDDNKTFAIAFRTPPEDDTGLPHILEHSVLCGSRNFPSKEPFTELLKGSLQTFLNAMTTSDFTMYPVASRNEKDFFNLMHVYLDAVFYPNIYDKPEIFKQEGWHYELDSLEDEITYKGVVYNEMRGAFSSPDTILSRSIEKVLFPDTQYGKESGGDPEAIVTLSREQFLAFHKKYYHPSNSKIILYGDGDLLKQLEFIDKNYLSHFEKLEIDSKIREQPPFAEPKELIIDYPISDDEDEKDKAYLSLAFVTGRIDEGDNFLGLDILEDILLETPASPLKKALLDAGIGKSVSGSFENWVLQPYIQIVVKYTNPEMKEKFKETVFNTLKKLASEGMDKKLVEGAINAAEFRLREADFHGRPKGLIYAFTLFSGWNHDFSPFKFLEYEKMLNNIRAQVDSGYFEKLIERYLLQNPHHAYIVMQPKHGLLKQKQEEIKKKLAEYKNSLSKEELEQLVAETAELKRKQKEPDPPEALAKFPLLSIADVNPKAEEIPLEISEEAGVKLLSHPLPTNKIVYQNLYFPLDAVPTETLPYAALLAEVLGVISTEKTHYSDLANEINIHTGGIKFEVEAFANKDNVDQYSPKLIVKSKALLNKLPQLNRLLDEIISLTRFDDKKRLREIINQAKTNYQMQVMRGFYAEFIRLQSYFSKSGQFTERMRGISFYRFLGELSKNFDSKADEIIENLQSVKKLIFRKDGLLISITHDKDAFGEVKTQLPVLFANLPTGEIAPVEHKFDFSQKNEGLMIPGNVQYVAKGYNFKKLGLPYRGSMQVLKTVASLDYLWNKVRVEGGAYGPRTLIDKNGTFMLGSYRDPNLAKTLDIYSNLPNYLEKFDADEREMTKYILGTISSLDKPMTPAMKGTVATARYLTGITQDDMQRERDEVLATKPPDIRQFAELVQKVLEANTFCVLGNELKIKENEKLFDKIVSVLV